MSERGGSTEGAILADISLFDLLKGKNFSVSSPQRIPWPQSVFLYVNPVVAGGWGEIQIRHTPTTAG